MKNESLLSIGQLCDQGYKTVFTNTDLKIKKGHTTVLKGFRNKQDGLWDVPFPTKEKTNLNYIVTKNESNYELAQYLHACAFSPCLHTFTKLFKMVILYHGLG